MAYTATQLTALQTALASGELHVNFDGRSVTYRSVKELKDAIAVVQAGLDAASSTPVVKQVRMWSDKGW